jgi:hypothetical protein
MRFIFRLKNPVDAGNSIRTFRAAYHRMTSGCSKRLSSKAAASEEARRTLRYVEALSDARTPLADFFSILRERSDVHEGGQI